MASSPLTPVFIRRLSIAQREELVRHVGGAQQFIIAARATDGRIATTRSLIEFKLLRGDDRHRPRFTYLTNLGREAAAIILAEYADALVEAGALTEKLRPIDLVGLIKAESEQRKLIPPRPARDYDRHRRGA